MSKEIKKLLSSLGEDLASVDLDADQVTLSVMIYTNKEGVTKSGQLRFNLKDVLDAVRLIDRNITSVRKLKKQIAGD